MRAQPPIFDLSDAAPRARTELVEGIARGAGEWGFFQVRGHGAPPDLLQRFYREQTPFRRP